MIYDIKYRIVNDPRMVVRDVEVKMLDRWACK